MLATVRPSLADQMRRILADCGKTRYQISVETGIAESTLSRFARGERSLSETNWNRLGLYFNLVLAEGPPLSDHERQLIAMAGAASSTFPTKKRR
jgi:transcriptional regulator with XRE-family HTH domain